MNLLSRSQLLVTGLLVAGALAWVQPAWSTTGDHRKYEILKQPFETGPEVTRACLSCHVQAAEQIMATIHWTWVCPKSMEERVGKAAYVINNFCIALPSNEPRCTSCHAGYGWKDKTFDFSVQDNVDCLVCHDTTGTYRKFPTDAGHPPYEDKTFGGKPWPAVKLSEVAQQVGKPSRATCGACHFYGGGGEGVKHADLDASLFEPDRELDVHMNAQGANFTCQRCHTTEDHQIGGRCYSVPATRERALEFPLTKQSHMACQSCHGNAPHGSRKLDGHLNKVSCQACHVPRAARRRATKHWWDWSKAGRMDEQGKPLTEKDELGRVVYSTKKGEFRWSQDFVPEYFWFDGSTNVHLLGDRIDAANPPVSINKPNGDYADPNARIWPMKVHRGKQPYDPVHQSFVIPKLFGKKGTGAYWKHFDWGRAIEAGMRYVERPYSGKYDFVETEMYWPIAHMVAPKEQAVPCEQCHQREEGRLAALTGFYMPGRDRFPWLDWLGWLSAAGVVVATAGHGALRYRGRRGRGDPEDRGSDERGRQSEDTGAPDDGAADEPSSPPESEPPSSGGRES